MSRPVTVARLCGLQDLAADFAAGILCGVDVEVPHSRLEFGNLSFCELDASLDRAREATHHRYDRGGADTNCGRTMEVSGSRGARQPAVGNGPGEHHCLRVE